MNTRNHPTFSTTNDAGVPPVPPEAHQRADVKAIDPVSDVEYGKIKNYLRSIREFFCAQAFKSTDDVKKAAGNVIVDMETGKCIRDFYQQIEIMPPCGAIQESLEFELAFAVKEAAATLEPPQAEALFTFSGIAPDVDLEKLAKVAKDAADEAYKANYPSCNCGMHEYCSSCV